MKKGRVEIAPKRASLVKANNLNKVTISPSFPTFLFLTMIRDWAHNLLQELNAILRRKQAI